MRAPAEIHAREKKPRVFELSVLNVLFCLLVIFIHVTSDPVARLDRGSWQFLAVLIPQRLAAFVVPGFILLSGAKMFLNKTKVKYKAVLARTAVIIATYLAWVLIYFAYFSVSGGYTAHLRDLPRYILTGDLVAHFYFIIVIVQFYALAPLWAWLVRRTPYAVFPIASTVMVQLGMLLPETVERVFGISGFAYADRIFTSYLIYWIAGCVIGANYDRFRKLLRFRLPVTAAFLLLAAVNAVLCRLHFTGLRNIIWFDSFLVLYNFSAILFFLMLAVQLADKQADNRAVRLINRVDRVTFGIYLSHILVMLAAGDLLALIPGVPLAVSYAARMVITYAVSIGGALAFKWVRGKRFWLT